jgi:hypothetical protein
MPLVNQTLIGLGIAVGWALVVVIVLIALGLKRSIDD